MTYPKPIQPPESLYTFTGDIKDLNIFTREQLRAEVERVRRETIEECAEFLDKMPAPSGYSRKDASFFDVVTMHCSEQLIRELLK